MEKTNELFIEHPTQRGFSRRIPSVWDEKFMSDSERTIYSELSKLTGLEGFGSGFNLEVRGNPEGFQLYVAKGDLIDMDNMTELMAEIHPKDYFKIGVLHVGEDSRRKGIGKGLYEFTESVARDYDCSVGVVSPSSGSEGFWSAMGFNPMSSDGSQTLFRPALWTKRV